MHTPNKVDRSKYVIVFFITLGLFLSLLYVSNTLSNRKLRELNRIQDNVSLDILSSETQYALLGELDCSAVSSSLLSQELNELSRKIEYSEQNIGTSDELTRLKKLYSLLEIKDYLLMKEVTNRCGQKAVFVLYFYTTSENCSECVRQAYVLTELRQKYPELRVYSFDYGLELPAIQTLIDIYKIEDTKLPALVIDRKVQTGFKSVEDIEKLVPKLKDILPIPVEPDGGIGDTKNTTNQTTN